MIHILLLLRSSNITTLLSNHITSWPLIRIIILFKRLWLTICLSIILLLLLILLLLILFLQRGLFVSCSKWIWLLWDVLILILVWLYYTKWTLLRTMECLNVLILRLVLFHNHFIFCHLIRIERLVCLTRIYSLL